MQSYPFKLTYGTRAANLAAAGDLFVYESADITPRVNMAKNSNKFNAAGWKNNVVQVIDEAMTTPKGDKLALVTPTIGTAAWVAQQFDVQPASTYSMQVKVAKSTAPLIRMAIWNTDPAVSTAPPNVNIAFLHIAFDANGVASVAAQSGLVGTPTVIDEGGGVYTVGMSYDTGVLNSVYAIVKPDESNTYQSTYIGMFQHEKGRVSPYIPTQDTPVQGITGDARIKVKAGSGAEIVLKPGQRVRMTEPQSAWYVTAFDSYTPVTVNAIIGSGEFDDANTLNTFKLDGTFTNTVKVSNDAANRVPVQLDPTATQNVSIVGTVNVAGQTVNYTNAFADAQNGPMTLAVITPAQNPNGLYVELAEISGSGAVSGSAPAECVLLAKNGVPASITDGDMLMATTCGTMSNTGTGVWGFVNDRLGVRIKVPAGKGLYLVQGANWANCKKTVLTTLL